LVVNSGFINQWYILHKKNMWFFQRAPGRKPVFAVSAIATPAPFTRGETLVSWRAKAIDWLTITKFPGSAWSD
jgi:hypothetical protein